MVRSQTTPMRPRNSRSAVGVRWGLQVETDSARVQVHLPALTDFESVDPALLTVPKTSSSVNTAFEGETLIPPPREGACVYAF